MKIVVDFRDDGYGKHYIVAVLPDGTEVDAVTRFYWSQDEAVAAFREALASIGITCETAGNVEHYIVPADPAEVVAELRVMEGQARKSLLAGHTGCEVDGWEGAADLVAERLGVRE